MTSNKFLDIIREQSEEDYGICPLPTDAQQGLNILIEHFLGADWYSMSMIHTTQVNTEAICEILERYPNRKMRLIEKVKKIANIIMDEM